MEEILETDERIYWYLYHGFVKIKDTEDQSTLQKVFDNGDILEIDIDCDGVHTAELFIRSGDRENLFDSITIGTWNTHKSN